MSGTLETTANYYDDNFVPGTTNILVGNDASSIDSSTSAKPLKRNKDGIILMPQPSESPNDPLNWSTGRKMWHFVLLSFITALTAATSNDAGAAQDSLNAIYGISYDAMNTGAGVLFIFIGWSCIFFAPASSLYGRRITYIICLLAGTLGSVWFALSRKTADTIWSQAFVGMSEASLCRSSGPTIVVRHILSTSIGFRFDSVYLGHLCRLLLGAIDCPLDFPITDVQMGWMVGCHYLWCHLDCHHFWMWRNCLRQNEALRGLPVQ